MRFEKMSAILILLLLVLAGSVSAQVDGYTCINQYIDCGQIANSSVDRVSVPQFSGRPGDTVWMPINLQTNDTVSGFLILVEYDSTKLKPVSYPLNPLFPDDTLFIQYQLSGQLQAAQDQQNLIDPNKEVFFAQISTQPADSGHAVIICAFNLGFGGGVDSTQAPPRMNPTDEVIFRLPFFADAGLVSDGDTVNFGYREVNEYVVTSEALLEAYCADCRRTNMSVDRDCEIEVYDTLATVPVLIIDTLLDTVTCTSVLYPSTDVGRFIADATPPPQILSFTSSATNDSVGTGDGFVLSWLVVDADSVFISGPNLDYRTAVLDGFQSVNAPATEGTYTYILTAWNQYDTVSTNRTILVLNGGGGGGGGDPHQPTIIVNTSHFVDVGNTLVFTVTATDPDNDFVTLEATSLPENASFPAVTGTGSASGTFTFTPALNQAGTVTVTFRASDGNTSPVTVTVQITVNEPAYDKLFTASTEKSASGGIPGKSSFTFPVNLVTSQTVYGVQFDFLFDEANFNVNDVLTNVNTSEYVIYHNVGTTPGEVRVLAFGMANEPIGTDGTEILEILMSVEAEAVPGKYPVYFDVAWESINPDPDYPSLPLVSDTGVIQVDMLGDVNLNLTVDVADLVSIVGHIIAAHTFDQRRIDAGDVNFDANVNVFDLVAVVNMILTGAQPVSPGLTYEPDFAKVQLDFNDLYQGQSDFVVVRSELPTNIAGVELEIMYDPNTVYLGRPEKGTDAAGMAINSSNNGGGRMKILLHSDNPFVAGGSIPSGNVELLTIPITTNDAVMSDDTTRIRLSKALLSTSAATAVRVEGLDAPLPTSFRVAQNYPNPFNPSTTIEFSFGPEAKNVKLEIFNIIGQKVTTLIDDFLPAGTHQVEWNSTDDSGKKVASGVYLYKLQVDTESQTKKMLLLK